MKTKQTNKTSSKRFSFTVKLNKWRCGGDDSSENVEKKISLGKGDTALRNNEGYMCCLGFACRAAGFKGKLTDKGMPEDLTGYVRKLNKRDEDGSFINTVFSDEAARINDNEHITTEERIKGLKALARQHKITINFVK